MTAILGISAFYHDSAAALVVDGTIAAAAQEERFTRIKHDHNFPQNAVDYCLKEANLKPQDLDFVGFYDKPVLKFDRLLETYLAYAPAGYSSFRRAMPRWLNKKLHIPNEIDRGLGGKYKGRYVFTEHHESHAASAFFPSPFEEAAIITIDGVGEWSTTCLGVGCGNKIEMMDEIRFPHSLGLLYSAFTYYLGFRLNSGEYKLMGLAPYGAPTYRDQILDCLMDLKEDGSFHMDMSYFNYCQGLTMTSKRFHELFGGPPRKPESTITQREMDLAASVQAVTEETTLRLARHAHKKTGVDNLVLAGGVALNCTNNGRLLREGPFKQIWVQPAAGDAGGALGAAQFIWHQLLKKPRNPCGKDRQQGSLLGPQYCDKAIIRTLSTLDADFTSYESDQKLCDAVAKLIADGNVVGWFQGRMEFGARALGSRSIIGDSRDPKMQSKMNQKIKFRESFRPFAPMVIREHANSYFEMSDCDESPYMLFAVPVKDDIRHQQTPEPDQESGLEKLDAVRSQIPAVTHVDNSARVQTVDKERNPLLSQLLENFYDNTGCSVLINTSFNIRGEPIVCSPNDAYQCFMMTDMDVLVLGRQILLKEKQTNKTTNEDRQKHLSQFPLD